MTAPQIVAEYADLDEEDVAQALKYALVGSESMKSALPETLAPHVDAIDTCRKHVDEMQ